MNPSVLALALFAVLTMAAPVEHLSRRFLSYPLSWFEVSHFEPSPPICPVSCITAPRQSFCSRPECQNGVNPNVVYEINEDTFFEGSGLEICPEGSAQPGAVCAKTGLVSGEPADHVPLDTNPADWS